MPPPVPILVINGRQGKDDNLRKVDAGVHDFTLLGDISSSQRHQTAIEEEPHHCRVDLRLLVKRPLSDVGEYYALVVLTNPNFFFFVGRLVVVYTKS